MDVLGDQPPDDLRMTETAPLAAERTYPPSELTELTIDEAAASIARGDLSPVDLTRAYLDRIQAVDPGVNAYLTVTAERALDDAHRATAELAAGRRRGPLHGIPLALKDLIDTAGIRTTGGAAVYADRVPDADATVAARLADAGAVLLGKVNLHELAFGFTTTNPHFGATRNPFDPARVPGGSSGGSAAATVAHLAAASIGTDTGGSVRVPASFCGCVGMKPTYGRVSTAGVMPLSRTYDTVGPIARTVADAAILLGAIAGYDPADAVTVPVPVPDYLAELDGGVAGMRIGVPRSRLWALLDDEVRAAAEAALGVLAALGATVVDVELPDAAAALGQFGTPGWLAVMTEESRHHNRQTWADRPADFGPDLQFIYSQPALDGAAFAQSLADGRSYTEGVRRVLTTVDLLVSPTTMVVAPEIGAETVTVSGVELPVPVAAMLNTAPFNIAGLPAASVPCGRTTSGLPVGLQLAGRPFEESIVLRAAHAYEQAVDWNTRTPL